MKTCIVNVIFFLVLAGLCISCNDDDNNRDSCYEFIYLLPADLDWLPYYSTERNSLSENLITLREDSIYISPKDYIFINNNLDTQVWNLSYAFENFERSGIEVCPYFQRINYAFLNKDLVNHFELSLTTEYDEYRATYESDAEFVTVLRTASCKGNWEDENGILRGACAPVDVNLTDGTLSSRVEFLQDFETAYANYSEVYQMSIVGISPGYFQYTFFMARGHGLIAYEFEDVIWELKI